MSDFESLAGSVAVIGDATQNARGEMAVLTCAVAALVRTHPAPEAFAEEFRRAWQLAGSQHSNAEIGSPAIDGIYAALEVVEEACSVPLGVRPGH